MKIVTIVSILFFSFNQCQGQQIKNEESIRDRFIKKEFRIAMRDGVKLFTAVYIPKNQTAALPFLIVRTPYSCNPYGESNYPSRLGPNKLFLKEPYIFVYQDVRGRYMSEGNFEEVTPHKAVKKSNNDVDESTDAFDTIDWLIKNINNNNGKAGIYGISYPGFYATASLPNAHPALKAVSPQAPVTDEFEGDDVNHRGAFFLMDNYSFLNFFDHPRPAPWQKYPFICKPEISNAYTYYLGMGPISNANKLCFNDQSKIWNEYLQHDTKDAYWQARDIRPHLTNIKPAVLVVGGWYDAEDLFGSLNTYSAIEKQNKQNDNRLVMGPWTHGACARNEWTKFGSMDFASNTSAFFQLMEFNFFNHYLKGKETVNAPEATIFVTGTNQWKTYNAWPPANTTSEKWYLQEKNSLKSTKPTKAESFSEYVSDPASPVPYMNTDGADRNNGYMIADQSFASQRKDVLSFTSNVFSENTTVTGPLAADLFVSTTSTDADFVVKIIDVLPDTTKDVDGKNIGGMQRLVRAEVIRGKFRNSFSKPEPFIPGKVTEVKFQLNDIAHTFIKGHQLMVQIQSSWFPLVDRNPQKFMKIPLANEKDFQKATIRIYHENKYPSSVSLPVAAE